MQHGLVVVTTPVGVEGIASPESFPGYVVQTGGEDTWFGEALWKGTAGCLVWSAQQDAGAFAEGIAEALRDPCRWQALTNASLHWKTCANLRKAATSRSSCLLGEQVDGKEQQQRATELLIEHFDE